MNCLRSIKFPTLVVAGSILLLPLCFSEEATIAKEPLAQAASNCNCAHCQGKPAPTEPCCPKCNPDRCILKCEQVCVNKLSFDVDQKVICIPRITWPWQKCCNSCAKARTVNILKLTTYECKECRYIWSLYEPPLPETKKKESDKPTVPEFEPIDRPAVKVKEAYDPSGEDVPPPPSLEPLQPGPRHD